MYFCFNSLLAQQYHFRNYSIESGLPKSTIFSILQDSRGYLWIGTDGGGVCRFDGKEFVVYNDKKGLIGNTIRCILEDSKGNLWFATHHGISVYNGTNFINIGVNEGLPDAPVMKIFEDSKNNMWAGSAGKGLHKIKIINTDSVEIFSINKEKYGISNNFIFDIAEADNKLYLALYYGGINVISFNSDTVFDIIKFDADYNQIPSNKILCVEKDLKNNLWFGSQDKGVFVLNKKSLSITDEYNIENGFFDNSIWDIKLSNDGFLWFGGDKTGLIKQTNSGFKNYSTDNGLAGNQIYCLYEDSEGSLWAGTLDNGISQFLGEDFIHFTEKEGLNQVNAIEQDKFGIYWLATKGNGLLKLTFKNEIPVITYYNKNNGLLSNYLTSLSFDKDGVLWIGTDIGISKFDGNKFKNYTKLNNPKLGSTVKALLCDSEGVIWCGTHSGIVWIDKNKYTEYEEKEKGYTLFNQVQTIIEDNSGNIWFGTSGGLLKYNRIQFSYFDEVEGLLHKEINALRQDKYGNIWIGTNGGGLFKYFINTEDSIPIKLIIDDRRLNSNIINSLLFLDSNTLIIGTDKGFNKLILDSLQNIIQVFCYDDKNGFIGVESHLNSIFQDNAGSIWFGTVKGLTKYQPDREKTYFPAPKINITDIELFYKSVDWQTKTGNIVPYFNKPQTLILKYNENLLTFKFTGIYLYNPEKVTYKFLLEGIDQAEWSPVFSDNKITYPGLQHGKYTFKVIAYNDKGICNEKPSEFSFIINPPFWKRIWFIILCVIFVIALIIAYIKYRERQLLYEKRVLEQKVKERTARIQEQKEEITKQRDEIAIQKDHIEQMHKDVTDSIQYAQMIQRAILPSDSFIKDILKEHFIVFKPRDIVSGDFYWLSEIDHLKVIAVADCTGHGVPGAFMSLLGVSFLNDIVNKRRITISNEIINELRKYVISSFQNESGERKEGMDIALSVINSKTNELQFSGAYNSLFIVRKKKEMNTLIIYSNNINVEIEPSVENENCYLYEIKADKMPVAFYPKMENFVCNKIQLEKGDVLYMCSDGFADQIGGAGAKKYMAKPLKNYLISISEHPMTKQKELLNSEINNWMSFIDPATCESFSQIDDIVFMGIRII